MFYNKFLFDIINAEVALALQEQNTSAMMRNERVRACDCFHAPSDVPDEIYKLLIEMPQIFQEMSEVQKYMAAVE